MTDAVTVMLAITAKDWNLSSPVPEFRRRKLPVHRRTAQWLAVAGAPLPFTPKRSSPRARSATALRSARRPASAASSAANAFAWTAPMAENDSAIYNRPATQD